MYSQSIRLQTKEDNPTLDFGSLNKLIGEKWNALDASAKEVRIYRMISYTHRANSSSLAVC